MNSSIIGEPLELLCPQGACAFAPRGQTLATGRDIDFTGTAEKPMRRLLVVLCGLLIGGPAAALAGQSAPSGQSDDLQAHAFDFLMGTWVVQNRFLAERLRHSHEWLQFQASDSERPLRTGTGNLEYYATDHWPNFIGMSLRLYDPRARHWTIYWSDNRFSAGVLQPPLQGSFDHGRGLFEGPDHFAGVPITVRFTYTWHSADPDHVRWTQAFSRDHGKTWETNWIMDFTRTSETAHATADPRVPRALRSAQR